MRRLLLILFVLLPVYAGLSALAQTPKEVADGANCYTVEKRDPFSVVDVRNDPAAQRVCAVPCYPGLPVGLSLWPDQRTSCACVVFKELPVIFEPLPRVHQ